uniref:C2H2-type domain-containing protein n=1 Tax=Dromaius novaehollandiae TaxID=8790 RepID=A0A8C4PD39_DRONO
GLATPRMGKGPSWCPGTPHVRKDPSWPPHARGGARHRTPAASRAGRPLTHLPLRIQTAAETGRGPELPFDSQYSSPVQQRNQRTSGLVPPAPAESNAITPHTCGASAERTQSLRQNNSAKAHARVPATNKGYGSPKCMKSVNTNGSYRPSQKSQLREKPYKCNKCQESFSQKKTLVIHQRVHSASANANYFAQKHLKLLFVCFAKSGENISAENPLTSPCRDHPGDKSDACATCGQHCPPRGSLASQQQSQGKGKSYICSDCGKSFICYSWLVRHQMTHTGERPYKCSECDKSYRRKDYLLKHQRRHSGERLFQCHLCRKGFVLRKSLLKHQESHVQETQVTLASWHGADIRGPVTPSV